ncbi:MAG: hypothetical protein ACW97V_19965 [Promethearchaeota archaeon]|jgi:hypothetical protein
MIHNLSYGEEQLKNGIDISVNFQDVEPKQNYKLIIFSDGQIT